MQPVVAVIAPGMMGSGVGKRLVENGIEVRTSLAGRSDATVARAKAAGMVGVSDEQIAAVGHHSVHSAARRCAGSGGAAGARPARRGEEAGLCRLQRARPGDGGADRARGAGDRRDVRRWRHRRRTAQNRLQPQDLSFRRRRGPCGRADEVRPGDADPARTDRRGLGDEDVLCRHHQGLHRAGAAMMLAASPCRHGGSPEGGAVVQPAAAVRLADAAGAEHVLQGLSLGRRDGGDRPVRRRGSRRAQLL